MIPFFFYGFFTQLLFVEGTHGINIKGVAAVFAMQLLRLTAEGKPSSAAWALVFHDIGLRIHKNPSFWLSYHKS